jgi:hypothetical protein
MLIDVSDSLITGFLSNSSNRPLAFLPCEERLPYGTCSITVAIIDNPSITSKFCSFLLPFPVTGANLVVRNHNPSLVLSIVSCLADLLYPPEHSLHFHLHDPTVADHDMSAASSSNDLPALTQLVGGDGSRSYVAKSRKSIPRLKGTLCAVVGLNYRHSDLHILLDHLSGPWHRHWW